MLFEDHTKLNMLIKMIGTREDYANTVKLSNLSSEEKDILMTASVQLKKKMHNTPITDRAYEILFGKQAGGTAQSPSRTEPTTQSKPVTPEPKEESASESKIDFASSSNDIENDDVYNFKDD